MKRLTATALAVMLLQASPTFAEGLPEDRGKDSASAELVKSDDDGAHRNKGPSLNSSQIAALQYREDAAQPYEPVSFRCQTRAGIFTIDAPQPIDTTCAANGLPGFMLP